MTKSAHQAAIDQAHLIASYLQETPSAALDVTFISRHLEALTQFAQAAKHEETAGGMDIVYRAESDGFRIWSKLDTQGHS